MNQDEAWGTAGTIEDVSGYVAIVGVGDAIYKRASGKNGIELAIEATERALADSGLAPGDIDGIMVTPYLGAQLDADPRVHYVTRIVDCATSELAIEMPMEVVYCELSYHEVEGAVVAPVLRPVA